MFHEGGEVYFLEGAEDVYEGRGMGGVDDGVVGEGEG